VGKNEKVLRICEEEGAYIKTDGEDDEEVMYIKKDVLFELAAAMKFKNNILNHLRKKGLIGLKHPHVPLDENTGAPLLDINSSPSQVDFTPQMVPITPHIDPQLNPNVNTSAQTHHTSQIGSNINDTQRPSSVNSQDDITAVLTPPSTNALTRSPILLSEHHSIPSQNTISQDIANDSLSICENIEISSTPTIIIYDPPIPSSSSRKVVFKDTDTAHMFTPITTALPTQKNLQTIGQLSPDDNQKNIKKRLVIRQPNAGLLITTTTTTTDSRSSLPSTSGDNIVSSSATYPSISSFLQPMSNSTFSSNSQHHPHNNFAKSYDPYMGDMSVIVDLTPNDDDDDDNED